MIEAAKVLYADLIASGVVNNNLLYEYAVLNAKSGDTDKAEEIFKRIISVDSEYALAYKDLAIIYLSRKFFDRAEEYFKKAYKAAPDNMYVVFEYANYFYLMSDFEQAKKFYSKLLKIEALPIYMMRSIALNYMAMNMLPKAKQILVAAIQREPRNVEILFHLAQIYYAEQNYQNARQLLEDAYTLLSNTEIANMLAQTYMALGMYNDAYALFNIVSLALPKNVSIMYSLAKCKFEQGECPIRIPTRRNIR